MKGLFRLGLLLVVICLVAFSVCKTDNGMEDTILSPVLSLTGGDKVIVCTWTESAPEADSYDVYYISGNVTDIDIVKTGTLVEERTSPYTIRNLEDGTTYSVVVKANKKGFSSVYSQVQQASTHSASGQLLMTTPILTLSGGDKSITCTWTATNPAADSYDIYYVSGSQTNITTIKAGTKLTGVTSPRSISGLNEATTYSVIVTANKSGFSSVDSEVKQVATQAAAVLTTVLIDDFTRSGGAQQIPTGAVLSDGYWSVGMVAGTANTNIGTNDAQSRSKPWFLSYHVDRTIAVNRVGRYFAQVMDLTDFNTITFWVRNNNATNNYPALQYQFLLNNGGNYFLPNDAVPNSGTFYGTPGSIFTVPDFTNDTWTQITVDLAEFKTLTGFDITQVKGWAIGCIGNKSGLTANPRILVDDIEKTGLVSQEPRFTAAPILMPVGGIDLTYLWTASDPAADSYTLYYMQGNQTAAAVKASGTVINNAIYGGTLTGLTPGQQYSLVVTANKAGIPSIDSDVRQITLSNSRNQDDYFSKNFDISLCSFYDKFEGTSLNLNKWGHQNGNGTAYGVTGWGNNELQSYRTQNVSIQNGNLRITAERLTSNFDGRSYASGKIVTANSRGDAALGEPAAGAGIKFGQTYGRFEAKLRMSRAASAFWPAFWMMPVTATYGGWPRSGEIDIMEMIGQKPREASGTIHMAATWQPAGSSHHRGVNYTFEHNSTITDWHIYGVVWTPTELIFTVDGKQARRIVIADTPRGSYQGENTFSNVPFGPGSPFDHDFFMILNLALDRGNYNNTSVLDNNTLPAYMEVEWVRVYTQANDPWTMKGNHPASLLQNFNN